MLLCAPRKDLLFPSKTVVVSDNKATEHTDDYKDAGPCRRISPLLKSSARSSEPFSSSDLSFALLADVHLTPVFHLYVPPCSDVHVPRLSTPGRFLLFAS